MGDISISNLMVQIMIIIVIIGIILYLVRLIHTLRIEKRFNNFSLASNSEDDKSVFDKIVSYLWKFIHFVSRIISKSKIFSSYGKNYERYIKFEDKKRRTGIDYVSSKILLGLCFVILNIITVAFKFTIIGKFTYLISFLIGFFIPDIILSIEFNRKREKIANDILDAVILINNYLKSGRNIKDAIYNVQNDLKDEVADEFKKVYLDLSYGLGIEEAFSLFYERVKLGDIRYIASLLAISNKTGSKITSTFQSIEKTLSSKKRLRNEYKKLMNINDLAFIILCVLPIFISSIIYIINPKYFMPLFRTIFGLWILIMIITLYVLYIIIIKKVLKVKIQ